MKIFKITRANLLNGDFPHIEKLTKLGLTINDLNERLKGRIRLLNKFMDLALKKGQFQDELDDFLAFSKRIADEIKGNKQFTKQSK